MDESLDQNKENGRPRKALKLETSSMKMDQSSPFKCIENLSQSLHSQIKDLLKKNVEFLSQTPHSSQPASLSYHELTAKYNASDLSSNFFGLPLFVKDLVFKYKGITSLYDWQIECLNCDAIKNRKNLIYTSPTSGGKTLVAEILTLCELLCKKRNVIFIMPYVAIIQEKVQDMAPFAVTLNFRVEEYAGDNGELPPRKHRSKNTVYFCTIEKAYSLINSLIESNRIEEIGLLIVDELHMIGDDNRGIILESLLTKLMFVNNSIQIVGMSATIGNLNDLSKFLKAEVYENLQRPVKLFEYVKINSDLFSVDRNNEDLFVPVKSAFKSAGSVKTTKESDELAELIIRNLPETSHLVFCPTKQACENLTSMLIEFAPNTLLNHKQEEKILLLEDLNYEMNISDDFRKLVSYGIVYHHAGLTSEQRKIIEESYRDGVISVICCTSTLAAGVNLPAKRVIIRKPYVGRNFLTVSQYKQMIGRAGRAGYNEIGESITIVQSNEVPKIKKLLLAPVNNVYSHFNNENYLMMFVTDCIYSGIANNRKALRTILEHSLLSIQKDILKVDIKNLVDSAIETLVKVYMISCTTFNASSYLNQSLLIVEVPHSSSLKQEMIFDDATNLSLTNFGEACVRASFDHILGRAVFEDISTAKTKLILLNNLHPLFLLVPYSCVETIEPILQSNNHIAILHENLMNLDKYEKIVCNALGITFNVIHRLPTTNLYTKNKTLFQRITKFYLALIMNKYIEGMQIKDISTKYMIDTGFLQSLIKNTVAYSFQLTKFCESMKQLWPFLNLFRTLHEKLKYESDGEISKLMLLPNVKKARAQMLFNAGFKTLGLISSSDPSLIVSKVKHISYKLAEQLIASANLLLMEKIEEIQERAQNEMLSTYF